MSSKKEIYNTIANTKVTLFATSWKSKTRHGAMNTFIQRPSFKHLVHRDYIGQNMFPSVSSMSE